MIRWRLLLSVLMTLWLPVSGYAAVAMPFCQHGLAGGQSHIAPTATLADNDHAHHHHHAANHSPGDAQSQSGHAGSLACNDCGACHLACSPAIVAAVTVQLPYEASVYQPVAAGAAHLFYPEQPLHPPLSALV